MSLTVGVDPCKHACHLAMCRSSVVCTHARGSTSHATSWCLLQPPSPGLARSRTDTRGSGRRVKSYPTYDPRPGVMVGSLEGHPRGSDLAGNGLLVIIPPRPPPPRPPPDPDPGPGPTDPIPPHINRPSRPCKMTNKNLHLSSPILAGHPRKNTPFEHFEVDIFHFFARLRRAGRIGWTRPRAPTNLLI